MDTQRPQRTRKPSKKKAANDADSDVRRKKAHISSPHRGRSGRDEIENGESGENQQEDGRIDVNNNNEDEGSTAPNDSDDENGDDTNGSISGETDVDVVDEITAEAQLGEYCIRTTKTYVNMTVERLQKLWNSPVYAFFNNASINEVKGRRCHEFKCANRSCKYYVRRFLDKSDAKSTSNLRRHAISCWGVEAVKMAEQAGDASSAKEKVVKSLLRTGSIMESFEIRGKNKVTYSNIPYTKTESQ